MNYRGEEEAYFLFFNEHHNLSSFEEAEYVLKISIFIVLTEHHSLDCTLEQEGNYLSIVTSKYHIPSHIFNICNFKTIPELQTIHLEKRLCLTRLYMGRNCKFDVVLSYSSHLTKL